MKTTTTATNFINKFKKKEINKQINRATHSAKEYVNYCKISSPVDINYFLKMWQAQLRNLFKKINKQQQT